MYIDLSSSSSVAPSSDCLHQPSPDHEICAGHRTYAHAKSATYAHERRPLGESIPYGGVSFADLHEVRDRWEVAGCGRSGVSSVEARRVRYVEGPFDERWDGRLGLGLGGALEGMGGGAGASVFGLRFPGEAGEGELALGGGNEALYDGEVVMHPVVGGLGGGGAVGGRLGGVWLGSGGERRGRGSMAESE